MRAVSGVRAYEVKEAEILCAITILTTAATVFLSISMIRRCVRRVGRIIVPAVDVIV